MDRVGPEVRGGDLVAREVDALAAQVAKAMGCDSAVEFQARLVAERI